MWDSSVGISARGSLHISGALTWPFSFSPTGSCRFRQVGATYSLPALPLGPPHQSQELGLLLTPPAAQPRSTIVFSSWELSGSGQCL